jgi:glycine/D-amino acid oxidase-like deaminating enzyme
MVSETKAVDFIIIGGGILGTAVAFIAADAGLSVLVLRLADAECPRADTLRNQGWLQSGIMYRPKDFNNDLRACAAFASRTFIAGQRMLKTCGIPLSTGNGILAASKETRIDEVRALSKELKFTQDEFRQLEADEVKEQIGAFANPKASYFAVPDAPFDEAGVLTFLRDGATAKGAVFVEVDDAVRLERRNGTVIVHLGENELESKLTLVTAGCGSFQLLGQLGEMLPHQLRRTPLLVSDRPSGLPADVYVDVDLGFSAVRHKCATTGVEHVVVGTRTHDQPTAYAFPDERKIPLKEQMDFASNLHPELARKLLPSRFTAGYEVMPLEGSGISQYEPWIKDFGDVVFASPGRATVAFMAATEVMDLMLSKVSGSKFDCIYQAGSKWAGHVAMHFNNVHYNFDDAEQPK